MARKKELREPNCNLNVDREKTRIRINTYIILFGYLLGIGIIICSFFSHADLRDRILFLMLGFLIMMRASQIDQSDDLRVIMFQNKVTNEYVNYRMRKDEEEKDD